MFHLPRCSCLTCECFTDIGERLPISQYCLLTVPAKPELLIYKDITAGLLVADKKYVYIL